MALKGALTPERRVERQPGTGGKQLAMKLKMMGGGPFDLDTLVERLDITPSKLVPQLQTGVDNGFIQEVDDTWLVPRVRS